MYIKNGIQNSVRHDLTSRILPLASMKVKCYGLKLRVTKTEMIYGIVYRHPSSNLETFLNNFYSVIGKINKERKLCLISGDFNINLLNFDKHPSTKDFINTLGSFFLEPHILKPTKITNHSSTLIDNMFFNSIEYQTVRGNLFHDLTDHLPNFLIIKGLPCQYIKKKDVDEIILII